MKNTEKLRLWKESPIDFIRDIWQLAPQKDGEKFILGKHITEQQYQILLAVEDALSKKSSRKITIKAGHGIGKTSTIAIIILWFLFCFKDARVSCTAPTSQQIFDVLWSEVKKWLDKMPSRISNLYEWQGSYVRIRERPETWFARAATARKEAPEAFAGIHAENVLLIAEEASGIPDEIFETGRGALTNENALVILIGNPIRLIGYFYDSHNSEGWKKLSFSSLDSPLVSKDSELIKEIRAKYGEDSDEWKIRILGQFPSKDTMDMKGYVPLLTESDLKFCEPQDFIGEPYLGVDPSGSGKDRTTFVARDRFKAKIMGDEKISNSRSIAQRAITLMHYLAMGANQTTIDNFGEGANVSRDIALSGDRDIGERKVNAVNVGDKADDSDRFYNKRAESYFRLKQWIRQGGELVRDERWKELLTIKYRRELNGKLKIMSKEEMRKEGIASQNYADALMLTFVRRSDYEGIGAFVQQFKPKVLPYGRRM